GPEVSIKTDPFHLVETQGKVTCTAAANPLPDLKWEYRSCLKDTCQYVPIEGKILSTHAVNVTSEIVINLKENGRVKCIATNYINSEESVIGYFVTDVPNGFAITGFDDTVIVDEPQHKAIYALGEKIHVVCSATLTNYSEVSWNLNGRPIHSIARIELSKKTSKYSTSSILQINNINKNDSGIYNCVARTPTGLNSTKYINISIVDPVTTKITDTNMKGEMMQDFPKPVKMHCSVIGIPKPKINWYKDNVLFAPADPRIVFEDERQTLRFNETKIEDAGKYKCEAAYKDIRDSREVKLGFSKELLVIVEYCRFGNLQNYLLRHREHFINQIDPHTGKFDYKIGLEHLDRTYSVSSNRSQVQSPLMKYAAVAFSDSAYGARLVPPSPMGDYRAHAASEATDMTTVTQGDDGAVLSNNSVQPEWRSNYKGDYKGNIYPISTNDLIAYAFQVARGMEYLASRKVLHGDLAARNILLSDENIVKICDFGLAKSMYKSDNYKKRGNTPLPVKWMAIESIRDRVFSTQSDVWSYGIVLWELFSLGKTPYPGMEADERLYYKLLDGYRLESPEYSPKEVYQIMTKCWLAKPVGRPSFGTITERIGALLEESLRKHYIDLNDPYLAINAKMLEGQNDYLSMVSSPSFDVIASPHYVNDITTQQSSDEGYMSMKPSTIFSPRKIEGML
uniref:Vascular endothelial growth factor receptor 1-like n=1 Tax=Diabrotica virgifera virgifera TaxID=50390 RepID=A0A6P7FZS9_DIAVI